jgi:ankyrin repeat protein
MRKLYQCTCVCESSPLFLAQRLLARRLHPNKQPFGSPLGCISWSHQYCFEVPRLRSKLQATLDENKRTTALHLASRHGRLLIVEALIRSGAHVNAQAYGGIIPLHGAVAGGHGHITRVLPESGADFMKPLPTQTRPIILYVASRFGFHDIVQLFFDKGMGIQV